MQFFSLNLESKLVLFGRQSNLLYSLSTNHFAPNFCTTFNCFLSFPESWSKSNIFSTSWSEAVWANLASERSFACWTRLHCLRSTPQLSCKSDSSVSAPGESSRKAAKRFPKLKQDFRTLLYHGNFPLEDCFAYSAKMQTSVCMFQKQTSKWSCDIFPLMGASILAHQFWERSADRTSTSAVR